MNPETRCHGSAGRACAMPSMAAEIERLTKERNEAREAAEKWKNTAIEISHPDDRKLASPLPWEVKR